MENYLIEERLYLNSSDCFKYDFRGEKFEAELSHFILRTAITLHWLEFFPLKQVIFRCLTRMEEWLIKYHIREHIKNYEYEENVN